MDDWEQGLLDGWLDGWLLGRRMFVAGDDLRAIVEGGEDGWQVGWRGWGEARLDDCVLGPLGGGAIGQLLG